MLHDSLITHIRTNELRSLESTKLRAPYNLQTLVCFPKIFTILTKRPISTFPTFKHRFETAFIRRLFIAVYIVRYFAVC
jgi:hypothetical protein